MVIFEEKQFLQELEYLVNIDSGSGTADGIGQIASFLIGKCSQLGLTVKKHVFDPAYSATWIRFFLSAPVKSGHFASKGIRCTVPAAPI